MEHPLPQVPTSLSRQHSFERCSNEQSMAHFETFYIIYERRLDELIRTTFEEINKTYATFRYFDLNEQLNKNIALSYQQIKLTKRKQTFAVLSPKQVAENPELFPQGCKKIFITDAPPIRQNQISIVEFPSVELLEVEIIKKLQLDTIWVGLLYRIGTDVEELQEYLVKYQHFQPFQITFLRDFYTVLESKLKIGQTITRNVLDSCKRETEVHIDSYNHRVEEHVRSKFNSRTVIQDITLHPFLNLLESRSYFNLIYIEGQIMNRFSNFKNITSLKFPTLSISLTLESFITLDDYIYTEFIFECLKKVKKYINRTLDRQPYPELVRKNHKDIIRQFRPSVNQYFLSICLVLKERAACLKEAVGSIIVKNRSIISTGYNGTPMGTINCYNGGCRVCNNSEKMSTEVLSCRCLHAQYNCILTAGITVTPGAILYSSKLPCLWCAKLIIQGQIKAVICIPSKYGSLEYENMEFVKKTLKQGKVDLIQMDIHFND